MSVHPLQCRCATVQGEVRAPQTANHVMCYCRDCQAFAYFLGRADDILDERGGSEVLQILPSQVTFRRGTAALACIRLTPQGLLRWYAACCNMPIGNTLANFKISVVGLVHTCLHDPHVPLADCFPPLRVWVNVQGVKGIAKPAAAGIGVTVLWFAATTVKARINGDYRRTPFFRGKTGVPVANPHVLSGSERSALMEQVRAAAGSSTRGA